MEIELKGIPQVLRHPIELYVGLETYGLGGADDDAPGTFCGDLKRLGNLKKDGALGLGKGTVGESDVDEPRKDEVLVAGPALLVDDLYGGG